MHYFQELPLALFTLLAQMAVGIILVGECINRCDANEIIRGRVRNQTAVALVMFAVATIISLVHVGSPLHGPFTILHLAGSWLSREILMVGITGFALLWLTFLRFKRPDSRYEGPAAALVIVAGVVLVFVMSGVYNQRFTPGWHNPGVFPMFLSSVFMMGALWHGVPLGSGNRLPDTRTTCAARPILVFAIGGYILLAASLPLAMPEKSTLINPATVLLSYDEIAWAHVIHALVSGGAVMLGALASLRAASGNGLYIMLTLPAFLLIVVGELLGRLVFYLSYTRIGM